jgi:hypothetical protein
MWALAQAAAQVTPFNVVTALLWAWLLGAVTGWLVSIRVTQDKSAVFHATHTRPTDH